MNLNHQKVFITLNPLSEKALLFIEEKLFEEWGLQFGDVTIMAGCVPSGTCPAIPSSQPTLKLSMI
jgi:hypothetical protein